MSKVYINDEHTGIEVKEGEPWTVLSRHATPELPEGQYQGIVITQRGGTQPYDLIPAEFRAVIEGGLRWMLETQGIDRFNELCDGVAKAWWRDGR